jgi:hypothetical protein
MAKKQPMYGSEASVDSAAIADASVAHALADSFDDEESEAALDALGGKINAIIAALEKFGILES